MFLASIKVLLIVLLTWTNVQANEYTLYKEGEHYDKLDLSILADDTVKQHIVQDTNKVQVIEFFSYGCYWCSQVHEPLAQWAATKQNLVTIYHYPAIFNQLWRELGKLYFTVHELDNPALLDNKIFQAIHHEHRRVWEDAEIKQIIRENNGNSEKFEQYCNSFVVTSKVKKAEQLGKAYKIDATPQIVIHGPHGSYTTSLAKTKDKDTLIKVVNYLVMREQKFVVS